MREGRSQGREPQRRETGGAKLAGANLTAVSSGGITGTPVALPDGWSIRGGFLIGPGADLTNTNLAHPIQREPGWREPGRCGLTGRT